MFKKISIAIILGFFITLFFAQYDAWTHHKIVQLMHKIARETLGGEFACTVQSVNFFSPSLILHDIEMKSLDSDSWWWRCKKCEIHCSWLHLLFKGCMEEYVVIDGFECHSRSENAHFLIEPHILSMMQKPWLPFTVELKSLIFKNAHFHITDEQYQSEIAFSCNSSSFRIGSLIKTTVAIEQGYLRYTDRAYVEDVAAEVVVSALLTADTWNISGQGAGTCVMSHMTDNQGECYFNGTWKGDRGRFSLRNAYNTLIIDPIIITERELRCNARFPLAYAAQCIRDSSYKSLNGIGHCSLKINRDTHTVDGQLVVEDMVLHNNRICDIGKIIFGKQDDDWKMRLTLSRSNQECKGTGYWHQTLQKGEFIIKNNTELSAKNVSYWRIKPHNFLAQMSIDHTVITGSYNITTTHALSDAFHTSSGVISYNHATLMGQGFIDENQYTFAAGIFPEYMIHHCIYKDKDNKPLITLKAMDNNSTFPTVPGTSQFCGSIAFPFIRSLLNSLCKYDVQGEGSVDMVATLLPNEVIADVELKDSTIRLPQTYNFIDGFKAHCAYDFTNRVATGEDINLSLHTGKMNCLRATAHFDQSGSLIFAHAPCILDSCLLNIKKDLFATVSGNILFSKKLSEAPSLEGHIIIDKAQLKENLFSGIIQKQLLSYTHAAFSLPDIPLHYNIAIETKYPIIVDTGFLQTNAHVNVKVYKDMHEPAMAGSIVLQSGTLNFPYKPLYISRGIITFSPEHLYDPMLELVARNKIKKYDVSLLVEGSLTNHQITLDATPPLSEEQIVGLLLVGAEEHSLNSMMPALIVQNLKNLIFSNNQSSFFEKYFKPLLGSFNINLVPSFTDQTGRGGLRGALEISLDDRWRAVIQKNFSLTEDTKFELEFLFSDDITFRAIRDERRDLGAEVEMRWKF